MFLDSEIINRMIDILDQHGPLSSLRLVAALRRGGIKIGLMEMLRVLNRSGKQCDIVFDVEEKAYRLK